ncbi:MAG: diguanylate cyclase [Woeseia sp.]
MQVLIVEDDAAVELGLRRTLELLDPGISVHSVSDLISAKAILKGNQHFDVALVDLGLPDATGIEAPTTLKAIREDLTIVVITGNSSSEIAVRLIRQGIQDYILKSEASPEGVLRSVRLACERHRREKKLQKLAYIDQLTGALNRRGLLAAVEEAFDSAVRLNISAALLTLDIDHFKEINDTHGHPVGDAILVETSRRISRCIRKNDIFGRIGGDEFLVILNGFSGPDSVPAMAAKMLDFFAEPLPDLPPISISIGIALVPDHADAVYSWMKKSDDALYSAKRNGRNRWTMYDPAEIVDDGEYNGRGTTSPLVKRKSAD